tara:strand:+ start:535 stop:681 length:147 start_codon:yes stop_codon:yes gene_type:complete
MITKKGVREKMEGGEKGTRERREDRSTEESERETRSTEYVSGALVELL